MVSKRALSESAAELADVAKRAHPAPKPGSGFDPGEPSAAAASPAARTLDGSGDSGGDGAAAGSNEAGVSVEVSADVSAEVSAEVSGWGPLMSSTSQLPRMRWDDTEDIKNAKWMDSPALLPTGVPVYPFVSMSPALVPASQMSIAVEHLPMLDRSAEPDFFPLAPPCSEPLASLFGAADKPLSDAAAANPAASLLHGGAPSAARDHRLDSGGLGLAEGGIMMLSDLQEAKASRATLTAWRDHGARLLKASSRNSKSPTVGSSEGTAAEVAALDDEGGKRPASRASRDSADGRRGYREASAAAPAAGKLPRPGSTRGGIRRAGQMQRVPLPRPSSSKGDAVGESCEGEMTHALGGGGRGEIAASGLSESARVRSVRGGVGGELLEVSSRSATDDAILASGTILTSGVAGVAADLASAPFAAHTFSADQGHSQRGTDEMSAEQLSELRVLEEVWSAHPLQPPRCNPPLQPPLCLRQTLTVS